MSTNLSAIIIIAHINWLNSCIQMIISLKIIIFLSIIYRLVHIKHLWKLVNKIRKKKLNWFRQINNWLNWLWSKHFSIWNKPLIQINHKDNQKEKKITEYKFIAFNKQRFNANYNDSIETRTLLLTLSLSMLGFTLLHLQSILWLISNMKY